MELTVTSSTAAGTSVATIAGSGNAVHAPLADTMAPASNVPLLAVIGLGFVGMGLLEASAGVLWADVLRGFGVSEGIFGLAMGIAVALAFPLMVCGGRLVDRLDKRVLLGLAFVLLAAGSLGLALGVG